MSHFITFSYLISAICFILSLRGLSSPKTALRGNILGIAGMVIAVIGTLAMSQINSYFLILLGLVIGGVIGATIAKKIIMKSLPQLIAAFHSLVGLAAVFISWAAFLKPELYGISDGGHIHWGSIIEMGLGLIIGAFTFTGSVIAFAKLQALMPSKPLVFAHQHKLNAILGLVLILFLLWFMQTESSMIFLMLTMLAFVLGVLMILPIGGADMPVVISMLNSYSGWAAAGIGFTLQNHLLIITGALVGSSGAILSYIMCKGMNRSFISVILGGFGEEGSVSQSSDDEEKNARSGSADDAAFIMQNASSIIVVPGYGMAVAQAQHALREMVDMLKQEGIKVRFAIHPVAGRMPGHMNVLLAEANVPYEDVLELDEINRDFAQTDVAFVIGANDVTNPSAKTDKASPIYGMPILDVERAKTILFVKRSLSPGYAGVDNELFYRDNTYMLFADAKQMCEDIIKALKT